MEQAEGFKKLPGGSRIDGGSRGAGVIDGLAGDQGEGVGFVYFFDVHGSG